MAGRQDLGAGERRIGTRDSEARTLYVSCLLLIVRPIKTVMRPLPS